MEFPEFFELFKDQFDNHKFSQQIILNIKRTQILKKEVCVEDKSRAMQSLRLPGSETDCAMTSWSAGHLCPIKIEMEA
jgi:hypothetical protein